MYLYTEGGKGPSDLVSIFKGFNNPNADNFPGNDYNLEEGKVYIAKFSCKRIILETGVYRRVVTGILKGNEGEADFEFSVSSKILKIGG